MVASVFLKMNAVTKHCAEQGTVILHLPLHFLGYRTEKMKFRLPYFSVQYYINIIRTFTMCSTKCNNTSVRISQCAIQSGVLLPSVLQNAKYGVTYYGPPSYTMFNMYYSSDYSRLLQC